MAKQKTEKQKIADRKKRDSLLKNVKIAVEAYKKLKAHVTKTNDRKYGNMSATVERYILSGIKRDEAKD